MTHAQKQSKPNVTDLHKNDVGIRNRMLSPFEEFDHLFDHLRLGNWMHQLHWPDSVQSHIPMFAEGRMPKVDIVDNEKDLLLRAELPGVTKKDLDISMTGNTVTIKAKTSYEDKEEKGDYYRSEIAQGLFTRTVALPAEVDIDNAKSSFKDGILELSIPKLERSQRRSIKIE